MIVFAPAAFQADLQSKLFAVQAGHDADSPIESFKSWQKLAPQRQMPGALSYDELRPTESIQSLVDEVKDQILQRDFKRFQ